MPNMRSSRGRYQHTGSKGLSSAAPVARPGSSAGRCHGASGVGPPDGQQRGRLPALDRRPIRRGRVRRPMPPTPRPPPRRARLAGLEGKAEVVAQVGRRCRCRTRRARGRTAPGGRRRPGSPHGCEPSAPRVGRGKAPRPLRGVVRAREVAAPRRRDLAGDEQVARARPWRGSLSHHGPLRLSRGARCRRRLPATGPRSSTKASRAWRRSGPGRSRSSRSRRSATCHVDLRRHAVVHRGQQVVAA